MSDIDLASLASLASPEVMARARKIKLFLMDVDGTLTDGGACLISTIAANCAAIASKSTSLPCRRDCTFSTPKS
jgi:hypothetical protein